MRRIRFTSSAPFVYIRRKKRRKVSTIRGKLRKNLYRRKNLLIATGCRIAEMQDFPVADMIPTMVLVMPLSALWTNYIAPLL